MFNLSVRILNYTLGTNINTMSHPKRQCKVRKKVVSDLEILTVLKTHIFPQPITLLERIGLVETCTVRFDLRFPKSYIFLYALAFTVNCPRNW